MPSASKFLMDHAKADIVIEGHTDTVGSETFNEELSLKRASAVADWLSQNAGLEANRIKVLGLGESQPVAPEVTADGADDPTGRQLNRRVEIRVVK